MKGFIFAPLFVLACVLVTNYVLMPGILALADWIMGPEYRAAKAMRQREAEGHYQAWLQAEDQRRERRAAREAEDYERACENDRRMTAHVRSKLTD